VAVSQPAPRSRRIPDEETFDQAVRTILRQVGEDDGREGLRQTPRRVREAWRYLTSGYGQDPEEILRKAMFRERCNEMVMVREIELYSVCEHHLLPFFGKCHIAYLPAEHIVGLSKLARVVDVFARRLQVQERLTTQVAEALYRTLEPLGVGVVVEARHLCMMMRGVERQNSLAVTSCLLGEFETSPKTRAEFFELVGRSHAL
jgi:GTP cyclohydrolase I